MKKTDILSLPKIVFAHIHKADKYSHSFFVTNEFIEVTYIKHGSVTFWKEDEVFIAQEGDIICITADSPITLKSDNFHCHHTVGANVLWTHTDAANALYLPLLTKSSADTAEITEKIDNFIYEPYLYENTYAKAASEFMNILCKINSLHLKENETLYPKDNILAIRAKKYIHKNMHKGITQAEVADFLGITPQHLCNVFKKDVGMSLIKYINTVKLKGIQAIMEKENMKLYEAAQLFGYPDANYVSYLYKKMFGRNITSKPNLSDVMIINNKNIG